MSAHRVCGQGERHFLLVDMLVAVCWRQGGVVFSAAHEELIWEARRFADRGKPFNTKSDWTVSRSPHCNAASNAPFQPFRCNFHGADGLHSQRRCADLPRWQPPRRSPPPPHTHTHLTDP